MLAAWLVLPLASGELKLLVSLPAPRSRQQKRPTAVLMRPAPYQALSCKAGIAAASVSGQSS